MTRIALAMCPFAHFGYLPLTLASIKAFVAAQGDDLACTGVDFSNQFAVRLGERKQLESILECLFRHDLHFLLDRRQKWVDATYADQIAYLAALQQLKGLECYAKIALFEDSIHTVKRFQIRIQGRFSGVMHAMAESLANDPYFELPKVLEACFEADLALISDIRPDLIGLYVFCPTQVAYTLLFAHFIKKNMDVPVFGLGALFGKNDPRSILKSFPCLDGIIVGGAEYAVIEAVRHAPYGHFENIPGLAYRRGTDIISNRPRYVADIDMLPFPDFSDFPFEHYPFPFPVLPLQFSRGCYWNRCAFCSRADMLVDKDRYVTKKIDRCIAELKHFVDQGVRHFMFTDDAMAPRRIRRLSQAIMEANLDIEFCLAARTERAFTKPLLQQVRQAGGCAWFVGVESFSQGVIDAMNKGTVVAETVQVLKNAKTAGIFNVVFLIHGFPGKGLQHAELEKKLVSELRHVIDDIRIFLFTLSAGSPVLEDQDSYGIQNARPIPLFRNAPETFILGWEYDGYPIARQNYVHFRDDVKPLFSNFPQMFVNGFIDPAHLMALSAAGGVQPSSKPKHVAE